MAVIAWRPRAPIAPRGGPMSADEFGSVTHWLGALAAAILTPPSRSGSVILPGWSSWPKRGSARGEGPGAVEDGEDAALSAFDSFCRAVTRGRFSRLDVRDDLWQ